MPGHVVIRHIGRQRSRVAARRTGCPGAGGRSGRAACCRCTRCGTGRASAGSAPRGRRTSRARTGSTGAMMLKPSAAPRVEPLLDGVGDLLGRAGEGAVPAAAAEPADQLAHGECLAAGQVDDQRVAALGALDLGPSASRSAGSGPSSCRVGRVARSSMRASCGSAYSGRISSSSSSSRRCASASVPPMTGTMPGRILTSSGSRPSAAACALEVAVERLRRRSSVCCAVKTASA